MSIHFDGDFAVAKPQGKAVPEYPIPHDASAVIYRQPFMQLRDRYKRQPLDSSGPVAGTYLVDETNHRDIGGGVITFDRVWATVPADRSEYESYVYPLQYVTTGEDISLGEAPIPTNSRIDFAYFRTNRPGAIKLFRAYKVFLVGSQLHKLGTPPSGDEVVAEDSSLRRYAGNIWERATRYVSVPAVTNFS